MSNNLHRSTSPYLLQHKDNPVHWHEWGEEAFDLARKLNKPILLSVGYSSCHWCHVMAHESFEDASTAGLMNELFVNIKLDREERPDIDHIYMEVVQVLTGAGGWPLHCFLLPDGRPFYGGTYFPPEPKYGRPSWSQVLFRMSDLYNNDFKTVEAQADRLLDYIRDKKGKETGTLPDANWLETGEDFIQACIREAATYFDEINGGFGNAPKFPQAIVMNFIHQYASLTDQPELAGHVLFTLTKMISGGIYDPVGGGFYRYSTDEAWKVPHFEKMLYDNAVLVQLLADVYKTTKDPVVRFALTGTLDFIDNEMTDSVTQLFYSALDADSDGVEGLYYTFTFKELQEGLTEGELQQIHNWFDISEPGNWEHTNILYGDWAFNKREAFLPGWEPIRAKLKLMRDRKARPGLDYKIIMSWNALMIKAYCSAYEATGAERYIKKAVTAFQNIREYLYDPTRNIWLHNWNGRTSDIPAFADDISLLAEAAFSLYETTFEQEYLYESFNLIEYIGRNFDSKETYPLYTFTSAYHDKLVFESPEIQDLTIPSSNAVIAGLLLKASTINGNEDWKSRAGKMIDQVSPKMKQYPLGFGKWLEALRAISGGFREVVITGDYPDDWRHYIGQQFIPFRLVAAARNTDMDLEIFKDRIDKGLARVFVCENFVCHTPISDISALKELI